MTAAPMAGLPTLHEYDRPALEGALTRYYVAMRLADVNLDGDMLVDPAITALDRARHANLLPSFVDDRNVVEFMHLVSGLPRSLCATWITSTTSKPIVKAPCPIKRWLSATNSPSR